MMKRSMCIAVVLCLLATCFIVFSVSSFAGTIGEDEYFFDEGTNWYYNFDSAGNIIIYGYEERYGFQGTSLTIPSTLFGKPVVEIGMDGFIESENLKTVVFPKTLKKIGFRAFNNCDKLESVVFPEGMEYIELAAFSDCDSLKSVTFPSTLKKCFASFDRCPNLERINISNLKAYCEMQVEPMYNDTMRPLQSAKNLYLNGTLITDLVIPEGVTKIEGGFSGGKFKSVKIPDSIATIVDGAFAYCNNLKSVEIPESVTLMGGHPFYQCDNLKSIYFYGAAPNVKELYYLEPTETDFGMANTSTVVYYDKTQAGWTTPMWKGAKTAEFIPDPCRKGHNYGDWKQTKAPTCNVSGEEIRTCACGKTETRTVAATGNHVYGDWKLTKEPTTTSFGEEARKCHTCTKTETRTIAKYSSSDVNTNTTDEATDISTNIITDISIDTNTDACTDIGTDSTNTTNVPSNIDTDTSDADTNTDMENVGGSDSEDSSDSNSSDYVPGTEPNDNLSIGAIVGIAAGSTVTCAGVVLAIIFRKSLLAFFLKK